MKPLGKLWSLRATRFIAVAAFCTVLQEVLLAVFVHNDVNGSLANAIGFAISAQVSFVLSTQITWQDRSTTWTLQSVWTRWLPFNTVAAAALLANVGVFGVMIRYFVPFISPETRAFLGAHDLLYFTASLPGVFAGGVVSFALNHFVTFRTRTTSQERSEMTITASASTLTENRPDVTHIIDRVRQDGVAFFLPAYNEAANLPGVVASIVNYFQGLDCRFTVIIVNDGSTKDNTYQVTEELASKYPGFVLAVHHPLNKGYGAALKTGIRAALQQTSHKLIGFCDADGQFDIKSFTTLVHALETSGAHLSVGYRISRADGLKRRVMGRAWHWLSSLVLGFKTARDVDCGFKVFTREMLDTVSRQLSGDYAAVSPEIIARAKWHGFHLVEAGVVHKARELGEQTGANLRVVIRSLWQLFQLRLNLNKGI